MVSVRADVPRTCAVTAPVEKGRAAGRRAPPQVVREIPGLVVLAMRGNHGKVDVGTLHAYPCRDGLVHLVQGAPIALGLPRGPGACRGVCRGGEGGRGAQAGRLGEVPIAARARGLVRHAAQADAYAHRTARQRPHANRPASRDEGHTHLPRHVAWFSAMPSRCFSGGSLVLVGRAGRLSAPHRCRPHARHETRRRMRYGVRRRCCRAS